MVTRTLMIPGMILCLILMGEALTPSAAADDKAEVTEARLKAARVEAARKAHQLAMDAYQGSNKLALEEVYRWSCRWLDAQREMSSKKADQIVAFEAHLDRMKVLEKIVETRVNLTDKPPALHWPAAQFYRIEAELWLSQAKAK